MINDDLIKYIETQKLRGITREIILQKLSDVGWDIKDIDEGLNKIFQISKPPENLVPNLMPKVVGPAGAVPIKKFEPSPDLNSNQKVNLDPRSSSFDSFRPEQKLESVATANILSPGPLPQGAVISSYRKDYKNLETINRGSSKHWGRFFAIIILVLLLLSGGVIFASVKGYINLPFEIPFFKPTPEEAMAKMMSNLLLINTLHNTSDMNITITTTETKPEKENLSLTILPAPGSKVEPPLESLQRVKTSSTVTNTLKLHADSDVDATNKDSTKISSTFNVGVSLFGGLNINFDSEVKVIDKVYYFKIPNFALAKEYIGEPGSWMSFKESDLKELSNMGKDLPVAIPQKYDETKIKQIKDLVEKTKLINKISEIGIENLGDEPTHHYEITIDNESFKNYFSKLIDIIDDPDLNLGKTKVLAQLDYIKEMKGEVWLSKGNYNLRKYTLNFSTNEFNLNDYTKMKVNIVLTSLLSKINEPVSIIAPEGAQSIVESIKSIEAKSKDNEIKENLLNIKAEAESFYIKHKNSYGIASPSGNCVDPVKNSLFYNSETIKSLSRVTNDKAVCYSTPKEWAVSAPLATDYTILWCIDSKGYNNGTKIPLTGPICQKITPTDTNKINTIQQKDNPNPNSKDIAIQKAILGIREEAKVFFTEHNNSYSKANPTGSCISPVKDSLFYQSESIVSLLESIHADTPTIALDDARCYSTSKAYAISVPLIISKDNWCADSTGVAKYTKTPLSGPVCK